MVRGMSALGQSGHLVMSGACLLYPPKRTFLAALGMSALGQSGHCKIPGHVRFAPKADISLDAISECWL
jgi:hypothetical protein